MSKQAQIFDVDSVVALMVTHGLDYVIRVHGEAGEYSLELNIARERVQEGAVLLAQKELQESEARALAANECVSAAEDHLREQEASLATTCEARTSMQTALTELVGIREHIATALIPAASGADPPAPLFTRAWIFGRRRPKLVFNFPMGKL